MKPPLTRAIIHSPSFDPNTETPWTFRKWEEQARKSHQQWLAAAQFTQQKQGLYKAFGITPKTNQGRSNLLRLQQALIVQLVLRVNPVAST